MKSKILPVPFNKLSDQHMLQLEGPFYSIKQTSFYSRIPNFTIISENTIQMLEETVGEKEVGQKEVNNSYKLMETKEERKVRLDDISIHSSRMSSPVTTFAEDTSWTYFSVTPCPEDTSWMSSLVTLSEGSCPVSPEDSSSITLPEDSTPPVTSSEESPHNTTPAMEWDGLLHSPLPRTNLRRLYPVYSSWMSSSVPPYSEDTSWMSSSSSVTLPQSYSLTDGSLSEKSSTVTLPDESSPVTLSEDSDSDDDWFSELEDRQQEEMQNNLENEEGDDGRDKGDHNEEDPELAPHHSPISSRTRKKTASKSQPSPRDRKRRRVQAMKRDKQERKTGEWDIKVSGGGWRQARDEEAEMFEDLSS